MWATLAGASLYRALMWAGSFWCHQLPARSPHLWGAQLPLCWRCAGVVAGAAALVAWLVVRRSLPPLWLCLLLALPLPLDVLHAAATGGAGDNARRLATGLLFGSFGTCAALRLLLAARSKSPDELR
jgi:uncharacterized membrane protein